MKKILDALQVSFMLFGYAMIIWGSYIFTIDTYQFWKYGEERSATVVALDRTGSGLKGGTTYYYQLNLESYDLVEGFRHELPIGKAITVLVLPEDEKKITIGNANSSLFELLSYSFGGAFMATLVLVMLVLFILSGPFIAFQVIKHRHSH